MSAFSFLFSYRQNFLDDRLSHSNKGVVLATVNLFLRYTQGVDYLTQGFYERVHGEYVLLPLKNIVVSVVVS